MAEDVTLRGLGGIKEGIVKRCGPGGRRRGRKVAGWRGGNPEAVAGGAWPGCQGGCHKDWRFHGFSGGNTEWDEAMRAVSVSQGGKLNGDSLVLGARWREEGHLRRDQGEQWARPGPLFLCSSGWRWGIGAAGTVCDRKGVGALSVTVVSNWRPGRRGEGGGVRILASVSHLEGN